MPTDPQHLEVLADTLLGNSSTLPDDRLDMTDIYEALAMFLNDEDFKALGAKIELCPIHFCDIQICLDDEAHGTEVYD